MNEREKGESGGGMKRERERKRDRGGDQVTAH